MLATSSWRRAARRVARAVECGAARRHCRAAPFAVTDRPSNPIGGFCGYATSGSGVSPSGRSAALAMKQERAAVDLARALPSTLGEALARAAAATAHPPPSGSTWHPPMMEFVDPQLGGSDGASGQLEEGRPLPRVRSALNYEEFLSDVAAVAAGIGMERRAFDAAHSGLVLSEFTGMGSRGSTGKVGFSPGDVVLLQIDDPREFLTAIWGCVVAGVVPVPSMAVIDAAATPAAATRLHQAWTVLGEPPVLACNRTSAASRQILGARPVISLDDIVKSGRTSALVGSGVPSHAIITQLARLGEGATAQELDAARDDVALVMLTSGTTSAPKAVPLSHAALLSCVGGQAALLSARALAREQAATIPPGRKLPSNGVCGEELAAAQVAAFAEEVSVNCASLFHAGGLMMSHIRDVAFGCSQVIVPPGVIMHAPQTWCDTVSGLHRAPAANAGRRLGTISWGTNYFWSLIREAIDSENPQIRDGMVDVWDLSGLHLLVNGGEAIVARTANRFLSAAARHGLRSDAMVSAWGMAETASILTACPYYLGDASTHDDAPHVPVGAPLPGAGVRIVAEPSVDLRHKADAPDRVLFEGETGMLQVSGVAVARGYLGQTQSAPESHSARDGWFTTGDHGFMKDGLLTITGRDKNLLLIDGVFHYIEEVEAALEGLCDRLPLARSCCVAFAARKDGSGGDVWRKEGVIVMVVPAVLSSYDSSDHTDDWDASAYLSRSEFAEIDAAVRATVLACIGVEPRVVLAVRPSAIPRTSIGKVQHATLRFNFEKGDFLAALRGSRSLLVPA